MTDRPSVTTPIRVRYTECDPMGVAHHTAYPVWFEIGRTDLCRTTGISYRELESQGILLVVVQLSVRYRRPARYDDELRLETTMTRATRARLEHEYALTNESGVLVATGATTLACVNRDGRPRAVPAVLAGTG